MSAGDVGAIMQRALFTILMVGGPLVGATMVVGLIVSVFQAATQINEATLTFVPKLIVVAAILFILGPTMLGQLVDLTQAVFAAAAGAAR